MDFLKKYDGFTIFMVGVLVCTSFIGFYPIYILDEARNSEAAREMLASGNYIVPFFNRQLRTDKPPLHYFFMILGYELFGVNAFGARFFSGIFGALTFYATYLNVKKWLGQQSAIVTSVILLSSLFFVQEFHLAVPDPYLIFFVAISLFSFFNYYRIGKFGWLLIFYVAIGFGLLTKGPIALVLPGLIIPFFLGFKKDFSLTSIFKLRPFLGLVILLAIAGPWYYLVHVQTDGEWTRGFFLDHNISRFGSEKEGHGGLFFITPLYVFLGLLPFSVFFIQGFVHGWKARKENDFLLFSFLAASITILFFSISSTKLPNYPMPSYPFVAVLLAHYLNKIYLNGEKRNPVSWSLIFLLIIGISLPIGGWVGLSVEKQLVSVRYVSLVLILTTLAGILGFYSYQKNDFKLAFKSIAVGWILTGLGLFGFVYPTLTKQSPVTMALEQLPPNASIVAYKRFDSAFPINFQRTFPVLDSMEEIKRYLEKHPDAFIITNTRNEDELEQLENLHLMLEQKALFENHTTRIYTK